MEDYNHCCWNCQIRIYIQRHYGIWLDYKNCPYTCKYAEEMREINNYVRN